MLVQLVGEPRAVDAQLHGEEGEVLVVGIALLVGVGPALHGGDLQASLGEDHLRDLIVLHQLQELAVLDLVGGGHGGGLTAVGGEVVESDGQHRGPRQEDEQAVKVLFVLVIVVLIPFLIVVHVRSPY